MIFPNHCQTKAPICMQMTPVSSTNMKTLKKLKMFKIGVFIIMPVVHRE